jgi:hypothetical protein
MYAIRVWNKESRRMELVVTPGGDGFLTTERNAWKLLDILQERYPGMRFEVDQVTRLDKRPEEYKKETTP